MTTRYYYLVEDCDLSLDMIEESMISLGILENPCLADCIKFEKNIRRVIDNVAEKNYHLLKFEHIFLPSMAGRPIVKETDMKTVLEEARWAHNDIVVDP